MAVLLGDNKGGFSAFFLGQHSETGWLIYFPVCFLLKTPLSTIFLIAWSWAVMLRFRRADRATCVYLGVPVVIWFGFMAFGRINIGLRHVLPIYPFLFVSLGKLAEFSGKNSFSRRLAAIVVLLSWSIFSSFSIAPHFFAYFNELAGGPSNGYNYLSDSNVDWGQDLKKLKTFIDTQQVKCLYLSHYNVAYPEYYGLKYQYLPSFRPLDPIPSKIMRNTLGREIIAISVMNYHCVHLADKHLYDWLRLYRPALVIGYSILLFDITDDADAHLELAKVYAKERLMRFSRSELERCLEIDPSNSGAKEMLNAIVDSKDK